MSSGASRSWNAVIWSSDRRAAAAAAAAAARDLAAAAAASRSRTLTVTSACRALPASFRSPTARHTRPAVSQWLHHLLRPQAAARCRSAAARPACPAARAWAAASRCRRRGGRRRQYVCAASVTDSHWHNSATAARRPCRSPAMPRDAATPNNTHQHRDRAFLSEVVKVFLVCSAAAAAEAACSSRPSRSAIAHCRVAWPGKLEVRSATQFVARLAPPAASWPVDAGALCYVHWRASSHSRMYAAAPSTCGDDVVRKQPSVCCCPLYCTLDPASLPTQYPSASNPRVVTFKHTFTTPVDRTRVTEHKSEPRHHIKLRSGAQ